jgi:GT2 family glycosyltransferase
MEAASNAGIRSCDSEYIVIHDDDDSWESAFLEKTVAFLETEPVFSGVITHTLRVNEVIENDSPRTTSCYGFNTWLKSIYLMEMAMVNTFPPISFLFKRSVYDKIGGYDERLPVLGDWDFNIRFLKEADIGVIPELLALYHHRDTITDANNVYGNTVNAGIANHIKYDAILRNHYMRTSPQDLGVLTNLAAMTTWQNSKIDQISTQSLAKGANCFLSYLKKKIWFNRFAKKIKSEGSK